jgi:hypothetical protein
MHTSFWEQAAATDHSMKIIIITMMINCGAFIRIPFPFLLLAPAYLENKLSALLRQLRDI